MALYVGQNYVEVGKRIKILTADDRSAKIAIEGIGTVSFDEYGFAYQKGFYIQLKKYNGKYFCSTITCGGFKSWVAGIEFIHKADLDLLNCDVLPRILRPLCTFVSKIIVKITNKYDTSTENLNFNIFNIWNEIKNIKQQIKEVGKISGIILFLKEIETWFENIFKNLTDLQTDIVTLYENIKNIDKSIEELKTSLEDKIIEVITNRIEDIIDLIIEKINERDYDK